MHRYLDDLCWIDRAAGLSGVSPLPSGEPDFRGDRVLDNRIGVDALPSRSSENSSAKQEDVSTLAVARVRAISGSRITRPS